MGKRCSFSSSQGLCPQTPKSKSHKSYNCFESNLIEIKNFYVRHTNLWQISAGKNFQSILVIIMKSWCTEYMNFQLQRSLGFREIKFCTFRIDNILGKILKRSESAHQKPWITMVWKISIDLRLTVLDKSWWAGEWILILNENEFYISGTRRGFARNNMQVLTVVYVCPILVPFW